MATRTDPLEAEAAVIRNKISTYGRKWGKAHKQLTLLRATCGHGVFAASPLDVNLVLVGDVADDFLLGCLLRVIRLQKAMDKWERKAREAVNAEKKLHDEFMEEMRYMRVRRNMMRMWGWVVMVMVLMGMVVLWCSY